MEPRRFRNGEGPEAPIKRAIKLKLEQRGWLVIVTHGNAFISGLPDLYCAHVNHGQRWIEVKVPKGYHFTRDQLRVFPELAAKMVGVWILVEDSEIEYQKLFRPPNFHYYIGHSQKPF